MICQIASRRREDGARSNCPGTAVGDQKVLAWIRAFCKPCRRLHQEDRRGGGQTLERKDLHLHPQNGQRWSGRVAPDSATPCVARGEFLRATGFEANLVSVGPVLPSEESEPRGSSASRGGAKHRGNHSAPNRIHSPHSAHACANSGEVEVYPTTCSKFRSMIFRSQPFSGKLSSTVSGYSPDSVQSRSKMTR